MSEVVATREVFAQSGHAKVYMSFIWFGREIAGRYFKVEIVCQSRLLAHIGTINSRYLR